MSTFQENYNDIIRKLAEFTELFDKNVVELTNSDESGIWMYNNQTKLTSDNSVIVLTTKLECNTQLDITKRIPMNTILDFLLNRNYNIFCVKQIECNLITVFIKK